MSEKFDPKKYKSFEELPEEQKPQFKKVEGGFVNKDVLSEEEAREEAFGKTESIDISKERIRRFNDVMDKAEKIILKGGDFDVLRPGFWQDVNNVENELAPDNRNISRKISEEFNLDKNNYFDKLIAIDVFYSLKKQGLLNEDDREIFLSSIPVYNMRDGKPTGLKEPLPTRIVLQYENGLLDSLKKISENKNIEKINFEANKRCQIYRIIYKVYRGIQYYNAQKERGETAIDLQEEIKNQINNDNDYSLYLEFKKEIDNSVSEYIKIDSSRNQSGFMDWGHYYGYSELCRNGYDTNYFIEITTEEKKMTESLIAKETRS